MMLAALATLGLLAAIATLLTRLVWRDAAKIIAALQGRSLAAQPDAGRPVRVRFSPAGLGSPRPLPALRAAA